MVGFQYTVTKYKIRHLCWKSCSFHGRTRSERREDSFSRLNLSRLLSICVLLRNEQLFNTHDETYYNVLHFKNYKKMDNY